MTDGIGRLRETYVAVWEAGDRAGLSGGDAYSTAAHLRNEAELGVFVDVLERESRRAGRRRTGSAESERHVLEAFKRLATGTLGWQGSVLEGVLADGFRDALRAFPTEARRFDAALSSADIYQAARNALTMFCLQSLLGVRIELTPSVLAYSLLYPYTDNLLDDPRLDTASKLAFGRRLGERLRGSDVLPVGEREARIFRLVGMIEGQWPRRRYPDVAASLVAIHDAQVRSLALLGAQPMCDTRTLVEIAVEKGGTSVLADGYLVSGALAPAEAECIFGLGVFLQLRDDLEDVRDDRRAGVTTVFSAHADDRLDEPTARALAVGQAVLDRLACFSAAQAAPIRDIMRRSLQLTIIDAAAGFQDLYGSEYLETLERRSPYRLGRLAKERRRLSRANGSLTGLLERWIEQTGALRTVGRPTEEPEAGRWDRKEAPLCGCNPS